MLSVAEYYIMILDWSELVGERLGVESGADIWR